MSKLRQGRFEADDSVVGAAFEYSKGDVLPRHDHPWAQLLYAVRGVMQVNTQTASWLVPSTRAIWIPAGESHWIGMRGDVAMRTLYIGEVDWRWPETCRAIEVRPLLRELILHIVAIGRLDPLEHGHARLMGLLSDLLDVEAISSLTLPMPDDPRARTLAERLLEEPGRTENFSELIQNSGASLRTIQRIFKAETAMSLEAWRMRVRMQHGMILLHDGATVTEVALATGYRSPSAFINAFRRIFGETPLRYRSRCDEGIAA
jgi:AraC-like DNA-binding protein